MGTGHLGPYVALLDQMVRSQVPNTCDRLWDRRGPGPERGLGVYANGVGPSFLESLLECVMVFESCV